MALGARGCGVPGMFNDVGRGTDHLRKIASTHKLDMSRRRGDGAPGRWTLCAVACRASHLPKASGLFKGDPLPIHAGWGVAAITDIEVFATAGAHACGADTVSQLIDQLRAAVRAGFADTSPAEPRSRSNKWLVQGKDDKLVAAPLATPTRKPNASAGKIST